MLVTGECWSAENGENTFAMDGPIQAYYYTVYIVHIHHGLLLNFLSFIFKVIYN